MSLASRPLPELSDGFDLIDPAPYGANGPPHAAWTALRRRSFREFMDALAAGYEMGKKAEPLFGVEWGELWGVPIDELRRRFGIAGRKIAGEGVRAAA